jgi:beta-lactamase regulating signal transducer with metallopeptidase domain
MSWWVAQNTLLAALLALAVLAAGRLGRLSPAVRHLLWLGVLVKLVLPPVVLCPLPNCGGFSERLREWHVFPSSPAVQRSETARPRAEVVSTDHRRPERAKLLLVADSGRATPAPERAASWARGALCVWIAGSVCFGLLHGVRLRRFYRLLKSAAPGSADLRAMTAEAAAELGIAAPAVCTTPARCSPMVFALWRPVLLWPSSLDERLSKECRRAVVLHELVHLRRRDHWVSWFELLVECVWWWNPLFWYVRRQMRESAELACDAWVVALIPAGRRAYAQALVEVLDLISWKQKPIAAVGIGDGARREFERRLTMILRERLPHRLTPRSAAAILALFLAIVPAWKLGKTVAENVMDPELTRVRAIDAAQPRESIIYIAATNTNPVSTTWAGAAMGSPSAGGPAGYPSMGAASAMPAPPGSAGPDLVYHEPYNEPAATNDQAEQLQDLEARLAALLAELHNLRSAQSPARVARPLPRMGMPGEAAPAMMAPPGAMPAAPAMGPASIGGGLPGTRPGAKAQGQEEGAAATVSTEVLIRARYHLPEEKAAALAAFLQEHLGKRVETRVDGKQLIVTASPDAQTALAHFIRLFVQNESSPAPTSTPSGTAPAGAAATPGVTY